MLVPLYTPIRTDEEEVSHSRVYYGGINVYLEQKSALFRHVPSWLTGVLDLPVLLRRVTRLAGDFGPEDVGAITVSVLKGGDGAQRKELTKLVSALRGLKPDVICLPNAMFVGLAGKLKAELGASILCTLSGEDAFVDNLLEPYRTEAFSLIQEHSGHIDGFIAVTQYYASHATEHFNLPPERVHVVPLGVDIRDLDVQAEPPAAPFTIGFLARICREKGLANLCEAFALLRRAGRRCCLRAAGYLGTSDRAYLDELVASLRGQNVADGFEYVGEVDRMGKRDFLRSLHVLSVPTIYHESKGLYILEAMACGVPVVQPQHGSFPELVEATGGGLLYDPVNPKALADGIARLMDDAALRRRLADQGRSVVRASFNHEVMADRTWRLCERYGPNG